MALRLRSFRLDWYHVLSVATALVVAIIGSTVLTASLIQDDAAQSVRAAYHLVHTGVMGEEETPTATPTPQLRREPLPILAIAAYLALDPAFDEPYTIADVTEEGSPLTRQIKNVNLFWVFAGVLAIMALARGMTASRYRATAVGLITVAVSARMHFFLSGNIDRLYTELPATALMLWAAVFALRVVDRGGLVNSGILGLLLGALVLTKSAMLYVVPVFVVVLVVLVLIRRREGRGRTVLAGGAILAFAALAIAPWAIRNASIFDQLTLSERGGDILAYRALLVDEPVLGVLYAYSPNTYRRLISEFSDYTPADLEPGGRLYDLGNEYKSNRWTVYRQMMADEGIPYEGTMAAEGWLTEMALRTFAEDPLQYLASIPVYYYRAIWSLQYAHLIGSWNGSRLLAHLTVATHLIFLGLCFFSVLAARPRLFAVFGVALGWLLFHAAFSHNITRYGAPPIPLILLAMVWLAEGLVVRAGAAIARRVGRQPQVAGPATLTGSSP